MMPVTKKRVLIVEDDAEIRNSFVLIVNSSQKFAVVNAYGSCEEAIKHLAQDKPDYVLMDIELPGMNGIQGSKIIKDKSPSTEIIMVTVYEDNEQVFEALKSGQQATYLNVKGGQAVVEAVKKCWASLYSPRAIFYRESKGFKHELVLISVVIQQMVDSKKAGVLFTANPITNSRDEMIIEASFGLGEAVVSGMVTPDTLIVKKKDLSVVSHNIGGKRIAIIRNAKGENEEVEIGEEESNSAALPESEWQALAREALRIESHYGQPMDIEWAIDDKLYILQARPITTLK
jgi:pyruvate,water dikinase